MCTLGTTSDQMTSNDAIISVWVQIEGNEPEKIKIDRSADIDDLKQMLFPEPSAKRSYHVYYKTERLDVGEHVPLDTHRHQLLTMKNILAPVPTTVPGELFQEEENKAKHPLI